MTIIPAIRRIMEGHPMLTSRRRVASSWWFAVAFAGVLSGCTTSDDGGVEPSGDGGGVDATCAIDPSGSCVTTPGLACCEVLGAQFLEARGCWISPSPIHMASQLGLLACVGPIDPSVNGCSGTNSVTCFVRTDADGSRSLLRLPSNPYGGLGPRATQVACDFGIDAGPCP
jgi:hypothetical protein